MLHRLRQDAKTIFMAGIAAVDPRNAIFQALSIADNHLHCQDLSLPLPAGAIKIVGAGKAAAPMAAAVEKISGSRLKAGLVVTKDGHGESLETVELLEASHPLPDQRGGRSGKTASAGRFRHC